MVRIRPAIAVLTPWLIDLRRRLHQCPELSYREAETSALARDCLGALGLRVWGGLAQTGLAAVWESGRPGPTVAFRADLDALRIQEPEGCPFASRRPGVMHACGHDFNLALMLGLARLAASGGLSPAAGGRLMFIGQPAEESGGGAAAMLADGLFEIAGRPDFIFAGHAEPRRPPGRVIINSGLIMAGVLDFKISVRGRGGHAGAPGAALNPLPGVARLVTALAECRTPPGALLTVTVVRGGEETNVIPAEAGLAGTLRWHEAGARETVTAQVAGLCAAEAGFGGLSVELGWGDGYPPTVNDPRVAARAREVGEGLLAPGMVQTEAPSFGGEDFSHFLEQTPGVFLFFGTGGPGFEAPLHSPAFKINEEALPISLEFWARLAERFLAEGG